MILPKTVILCGESPCGWEARDLRTSFRYLNRDVIFHMYKDHRRLYLHAVPYRLAQKDQRLYRVTEVYYTLQDMIDTPEDTR